MVESFYIEKNETAKDPECFLIKQVDNFVDSTVKGYDNFRAFVYNANSKGELLEDMTALRALSAERRANFWRI